MPKGVVIVLLVAALVAGFGLGWYWSSRQYEIKIEKVIHNFPDVGVVRKTPEVMKALNGSVKSIDGNTLAMTVQPSPNPFEEWPLERIITVGPDTQLVKRLVKDFNKYQEEQKAYVRNPVGEYPQPYEDVSIEISEIAANANIVVESPENIKFAANITPTLIRLLP